MAIPSFDHLILEGVIIAVLYFSMSIEPSNRSLHPLDPGNGVFESEVGLRRAIVEDGGILKNLDADAKTLGSDLRHNVGWNMHQARSGHTEGLGHPLMISVPCHPLLCGNIIATPVGYRISDGGDNPFCNVRDMAGRP